MKKVHSLMILGLAIILAACSQDSSDSPLEVTSFTVADYSGEKQDIAGYVYDTNDEVWEEVGVAEGTITEGGLVSLEFEDPASELLVRMDEDEGVTVSDTDMRGTFLDGIVLADESWVEPDWQVLNCETDCDHLVGERVGLGFIYVDRNVTITFNQSMEGLSTIGNIDLARGWHFVVQEVVSIDSSEETATFRVRTGKPNSVDWFHFQLL